MSTWTGEVTQLVKCLPHSYGGPSLIPRNHRKMAGMVGTGEVRQEDPEAHCLAGLI